MMADIYLTNSLTRKKEKFLPIKPPKVGMYTCGPTVYDYASIGNFRTYTTADILVRVLQSQGFNVRHIMNLTDVGHLTGDNLGDADIGEDRVEKAAKKEGKTAWDIAKFYTQAFLKDFEKLNLGKPENFVKATDHINEQIDLVKNLEEKGFTYKTSVGIYFDTKLFEKMTGKKYGELSTMDTVKEGARVEPNPEKKNPRDFALWKFSEKPGIRHMEWQSPWGTGFPGWHIECSAMSMKYLGEAFDIHVGGEDLRQTHHPNEIAQSEAATGKTFVKYWIHVTHLRVDGKRMGRSLGNVYTISDIEKKGYDALSLRYLYLTAHYKDPLNFTWEGLSAAQNALDRLRTAVISGPGRKQRTALSEEKMRKIEKFREKFLEAVNGDLNTPQGLAVLWQVLKSNIPSKDKYDLALFFDEVLGLGLAQIPKSLSAQAGRLQIPSEVRKLLPKRERLREEGKFDEADKIRKQIADKGYLIEDTSDGPRLKVKKG